MRCRFFFALCALGSLAAAAQAAAPAWPERPIRLIVPYPPGSGTEFTAREVAAMYSRALGQPVVIDTRPGAGAVLGHALAAKAAPDGYTLLLATAGGLASGPALDRAKIPYDPVKDFAPIGLATWVPYAVIVTAGLPAQNIRELIALAKSAPGKLNVASPGVGTPNHLGAAQLMLMAGIELVHVPYKGSTLALTDVMAGNVQVLVTNLSSIVPYHRAGRLRILAIGHPQRLKSYPEFPTVAETLPGYYNTGWWGIAAPAGTAPALIAQLNGIMNQGLVQADVIARFEKNGLEVATTTPREFGTMIAADLRMWTKIIKEAKITVDVLP